MTTTNIIERDMTPSELDLMNLGFDKNTIDHGVISQSTQRFGYVAMDGVNFIGCVSGLAYKHGTNFSGWCQLTDLFVEKDYRQQGIGGQLLNNLENLLLRNSINKIWTWTAGYEAPQFYIKQGFEIFAEMENWYSNGDSRVGLRKKMHFHGS